MLFTIASPERQLEEWERVKDRAFYGDGQIRNMLKESALEASSGLMVRIFNPNHRINVTTLILALHDIFKFPAMRQSFKSAIGLQTLDRWSQNHCFLNIHILRLSRNIYNSNLYHLPLLHRC